MQALHVLPIASVRYHADIAGVNDTPDNRAALGRRIREAREAAGFHNKSEFSRLVGVQGPTLHRWEKGQIAPEVWNLHEIARLTRVTMEWLLTGAADSRHLGVLRQWIERKRERGEDLAPEAVAFLERVDVSGYAADAIFYDLVYLGWQRGLSPDEATRAARATAAHHPRQD